MKKNAKIDILFKRMTLIEKNEKISERENERAIRDFKMKGKDIEGIK